MFIASLSELVLSSRLSFLVLFPLTGMLLWRLWRFTIRPKVYPGEPKELPYWTPGIGHAISYLRDSYSTVNYGREYFNDDRKPFSINIAGELMYIITAPRDVIEAYRNTEFLTMDVFLRDLMTGFQVSESAVEKVYWKPDESGKGRQLLSENPHHKSLAHLTVDFYRSQLYPGARLTELGEITCDFIEEAVRWENLNGPKYVLSESTGHKDISLLHWCEDVLLKAAARVFFGDALLETTPDILDKFLGFDNVSWKLMYRVPKLLSKDMLEYKNGLADAVEAYFSLPKDKRPGANWFIQMQEAEMRELGISTRDISHFISLIYWVVNTNAYKLLFWMIAFLLHNPSLVPKITAELQATFRTDGSLDVAALQTQTPYLTALWHESLRVCNSSASARFVTKDVQIGNCTLRAGRRLLIPYRQLHLNTGVFGANAAEFDISRFLNDKKLAQNPSFRPFGGGVTYCPGRFLAKQEIFMAMAFLLCRNDVQLVPGMNQTFPRMDVLKPGIGIIGPVNDDDLMIRLTPKKASAVDKQPHPQVGWAP